KPLKDRKVVTVDRDNFNDVLAKSGARVAVKVDNKLTGEGDSKLAVELNFKHIDDFEPARVAQQIGPLRDLLDMRNRLTQLMSKMEGNDKLEELLGQVLQNTDQAMQLAKEMGIEAGPRQAPPSAPPKAPPPIGPAAKSPGPVVSVAKAEPPAAKPAPKA